MVCGFVMTSDEPSEAGGLMMAAAVRTKIPFFTLIFLDTNRELSPDVSMLPFVALYNVAVKWQFTYLTDGNSTLYI
jgi:hypothetical protein